jgi:DNA (cytosine-5)-methyltransferase 1
MITVVDLFCGCGAVTLGLKNKGFQIVAAVDNDPIACATYQKNHPEVNLYVEDITKVKPDLIKKHLKGRELDLLVVCAPCQPFSTLNKNSKPDDRRGLILQAIRFIPKLKPKTIFFENVPGLASVKHSSVLDILLEKLSKIGYKVNEPTQLDAADYGVPQRRIRWILLAVKGDKIPPLPKAVTPEGQRISVKQSIGMLQPLKSGQKDSNDSLHFARAHKEITLQRLKFIPKNGGTRFSLPEKLVLKCHKGFQGHPDVYGRMSWNDIAPTLTTGCTDITKGRFAHPQDDRAITLREAALLQTFPTSYSFCGNATQIANQIGNAVPVRLVEELASMLRKSIPDAKN